MFAKKLQFQSFFEKQQIWGLNIQSKQFFRIQTTLNSDNTPLQVDILVFLALNQLKRHFERGN